VSPKLGKAIHYIGNFLSLCGVVFILFLINEYFGQLNLAIFDPIDCLLIIVIIVVYASSNLLLSHAWWQLTLYEDFNIEQRKATKIFGITQISKYIPGNIFHLASRQILTMNEGASSKKVAKTMVLEHGLLAIAGIGFISLLLPLVLPNQTAFTSYFLFMLITILIAAYIRFKFSLSVVKAYLCYLLFLLVSGLLFWAICLIVQTGQPLHLNILMGLIAAYVIAWLLGLITPGAPAGLGVREYVLLILLSEQFSEPELLLAILVGRFVTACGDTLFFLKAKFYC
jgi:hypothetical protein